MKIIGRTLAILAAALAVAGITFALARNGLIASGRGGRPERGAFGPSGQFQPQRGLPPGGAPFGSGEFRGGPDHEGGRGASLFGVVEIVKNLVIMGAIIAVVSMLMRRLPAQRDRKPQARQMLE